MPERYTIFSASIKRVQHTRMVPRADAMEGSHFFFVSNILHVQAELLV